MNKEQDSHWDVYVYVYINVKHLPDISQGKKRAAARTADTHTTKESLIIVFTSYDQAAPLQD